MIPRIFESVGHGTVADGFWTYFEVDPRSPTVNPQQRLVRLATRVREFLRPDGTLLSIGCGYGVYEILLSFLPSELEIIGVDILDDKRSDAKVRSMRSIAIQLRADRVSPLLADGGQLPFRSGSFDCAMAIDCLSHTDYMRGNLQLHDSQTFLLEEMTRVVRPGGHLAAIENNGMSPRNVMRKHGTTCHPVNPLYLKSVLEKLDCTEVRIAPYYDLNDRKGPSARVVGALLEHSNTVGLLLAPFFMLGARNT